MRRMNPRWRWAVGVGLGLLSLAWAVPPWKQSNSPYAQDADANLNAIMGFESNDGFIGFAPLLKPPPRPGGIGGPVRIWWRPLQIYTAGIMGLAVAFIFVPRARDQLP